MNLKTPAEIDAMAEAGRAVALTLDRMRRAIRPGETTTQALDDLARESLAEFGAVPALLNYQPAFSQVPYLHATCISTNDEVIHGVPGSRVIQNGDVLGLDLCASIDGWHADSAITVIVGEGSPKAQRLVEVTRAAMWRGIEAVKPGATLGDVGATVQKIVERNRMGVLRELAGHGIGRKPHEEGLDVFNFGRPRQGVRLAPGMTFCVEPMVSFGNPAIKHRPGDPWSILTKDGSLGAHFEHTVAVTEDGVRVLTALPKEAPVAA